MVAHERGDRVAGDDGAVEVEERAHRRSLGSGRDGVEQRWFCGAHADVGGGYPSLEFCSVSLDWMIERLRAAGIVVSAQYAAAGPFPFGPFHTPYKEPPFNLRPHGPRPIPAGSFFHPSVQQRLDGYADYAPPNLGAFLNGRTLDPQTVRP